MKLVSRHAASVGTGCKPSGYIHGGQVFNRSAFEYRAFTRLLPGNVNATCADVDRLQTCPTDENRGLARPRDPFSYRDPVPAELRWELRNTDPGSGRDTGSSARAGAASGRAARGCTRSCSLPRPTEFRNSRSVEKAYARFLQRANGSTALRSCIPATQVAMANSPRFKESLWRAIHRTGEKERGRTVTDAGNRANPNPGPIADLSVLSGGLMRFRSKTVGNALRGARRSAER